MICLQICEHLQAGLTEERTLFLRLCACALAEKEEEEVAEPRYETKGRVKSRNLVEGVDTNAGFCMKSTEQMADVLVIHVQEPNVEVIKVIPQESIAEIEEHIVSIRMTYPLSGRMTCDVWVWVGGCPCGSVWACGCLFGCLHGFVCGVCVVCVWKCFMYVCM